MFTIHLRIKLDTTGCSGSIVIAIKRKYNDSTTCRILESNIIQSVSRLVDITVGGDFLSLCDQNSSYEHVSDFGRLRSYDCLKLRIEGNDY